MYVDCPQKSKSSIVSDLNFLMSQPKHMLWVLKTTIPMQRFFWAPKRSKRMSKWMDKKIFSIFRSNFISFQQCEQKQSMTFDECSMVIMMNIQMYIQNTNFSSSSFERQGHTWWFLHVLIHMHAYMYFSFTVNLTSEVPGRFFRSFMIQARRIDTDENIVQPIGKFTALDDEIDAINKCINEPYGVS